MSALTNKAIDFLTKETRKIPQILIMLLIFTMLFPKTCIEAKNIFIEKVQAILPETISKLYISHQEFLIIWQFFLLLFAVTFILDILHQVLKGQSYLIIGKSGTTLLEINSILFLLTLIYNTLYQPGIIIPSISFDNLYNLSIFISAYLFALIFFISYGADAVLIFKKTKDSALSNKIKIFLYIVYIFIDGQILTKIFNTLFISN